MEAWVSLELLAALGLARRLQVSHPHPGRAEERAFTHCLRAGAAEFDGRGGDEAAACVDFCEARDIPTAQRFRVLSKLRLLNRICDREGRQTIVTMRLLAFTALIQGNPEHGTRGGARPQESAAPTRCARDAAGPRPPARRAL